MFLKSVEIDRFRNFQNAKVEFSQNDFSKVYSVASINGGGKSTLLQFIYVMLSCFKDPKLHKYLVNFLNTEQFQSDYQNRVAHFVIDAGEEIDLEFVALPVDNEHLSFSVLNDIEDLKIELKEQKEEFERSQDYIQFSALLQSSTSVTEELRNHALKFTSKLVFPKSKDYDTYIKMKRSNDLDDFKEFAEYLRSRGNYTIEDKTDALNRRKDELDALLIEKKELLKKDGFTFLTPFADGKLLLLLKSNACDEMLDKISKAVYLNGPDTQIYLFMSTEDKQSLLNKTNTTNYFDYDKFGKEIYVANNYNDRIRKIKKELKNYYTYDFVSKDMILKACKKAFEEDNKEKLRTGEFGSHYDKFIKSLNTFYDDKEIQITEDMEDVKFFLTSEKKELNPEDLSHGELKRLSIFIWLKYLIQEDSIILMDEIDIALHPKWLYKVANDLDEWTNDNQIILATHSPQIVSTTYYKNIIKLDNVDSVVVVKKYMKPPLGRDINAIVKTIMDAPNFPSALLELHKKYRQLVNEGKVETQEAKELKEEILEHENENSAFFQEINFDLDLFE